MPEPSFALYAKTATTEAELRQRLQREPTTQELAEAADISVERLEALRALEKDAVRLDATPRDSAELRSETIEDPSQDPQRACDRWMAADEVGRMLKGMVPRQQAVLRARYGLDTGTPRTLREIGVEWGVTRERIRQIERAALDALRKRWVESGGRLAGQGENMRAL